MDSERFYHSVLEILDDLDNRAEVNSLIAWWDRLVAEISWPKLSDLPDRKVFPGAKSANRALSAKWTTSRLKAVRNSIAPPPSL